MTTSLIFQDQALLMSSMSSALDAPTPWRYRRHAGQSTYDACQMRSFILAVSSRHGQARTRSTVMPFGTISSTFGRGLMTRMSLCECMHRLVLFRPAAPSRSWSGAPLSERASKPHPWAPMCCVTPLQPPSTARSPRPPVPCLSTLGDSAALAVLPVILIGFS
jgi:hypothetical protein